MIRGLVGKAALAAYGALHRAAGALERAKDACVAAGNWAAGEESEPDFDPLEPPPANEASPAMPILDPLTDEARSMLAPEPLPPAPSKPAPLEGSVDARIAAAKAWP